MVEVNPQSGGDIRINTGWFIFALVAVPLFALLFYFVENSGWNWYVLGTLAIVAFVVELGYFRPPAAFIIFLVIGIIAAVLIKMYVLTP